MAKILLINPWNYHDEGVEEHDLGQEWRNGPYALLILGSVLKKAGHSVRLLDLQRDLVALKGKVSDCIELLKRNLDQFHPDIVGISFFSVQFLEVKRIVQEIRRENQNRGLHNLIIVGGIHPTVEPEQTVSNMDVDYAFVGEGEKGLLRLAGGENPEKIPGFFKIGQKTITRGEEIKNLDEIPFPEWEFCDYNFYSSPTYARLKIKKTKSLDLLLGRGCPYQCSFCAYGRLSQTRFHSTQYVIEQMEKLKMQNGVETFFFLDSSVGTNKTLLTELCENLKRKHTHKNTTWLANMRANQINESILTFMREAGCEFLLYGFESGSDRVLKMMKKNCMVEDNLRAAELHNKMRFPYAASMIFGFPGEKEDDVQKTIDFLWHTKPPSIGINWFVPLPGSLEYLRLKKEGAISLIEPDSWRKIGEVNGLKYFGSLPEEQGRQLYEKLKQIAYIEIPSRLENFWFNPLMLTHQDICLQEKTKTEIDAQLREKWREIPSTRVGRQFSSNLLSLSDPELLSFWENCKNETTVPDVRGWYQNLYKYQIKNKEILEIGPGIGVDAVYFAQNGARVTIADIVPDNLLLVKRILGLKGFEVGTYFIKDFHKYYFDRKFDIFFCIGSLINAPFEFTKSQVDALIPFLKIGGRILFLGYPYERFVDSGACDGSEFGKTTDGERTPWVEWYDEEKIGRLFGQNIKILWSRNFGQSNREFNWFEMCKISETNEKKNFSTSDSYKNLNIDKQIPINNLSERKGVSKETSFIDFPSVKLEELGFMMGFQNQFEVDSEFLQKPLRDRTMKDNDCKILKFIFRNLMPRRHLEIGTWEGIATLSCLESSDASVWTVNLPFGEQKSNGNFVYGANQQDISELNTWAMQLGFSPRDNFQTDSIGFIGRKFLEHGFGKRVCQIYSDSREWDTSVYPAGFFDSALIDGGHECEVVFQDTQKVFPLVREGGLILWHDFCPPIFKNFPATRGVMKAIYKMWPWLLEQTSSLFWINPSWLLLGVKK